MNSYKMSGGGVGENLNKRKTFYDKSHLDLAVDMVIKNKLSMRAASHIYNIPFSTLRTRKVYLTSSLPTATESNDKLNKKLIEKQPNKLPAAVIVSPSLNGNNDDDYNSYEDFDDPTNLDEAVTTMININKNNIDEVYVKPNDHQYMIKNEKDTDTESLNDGLEKSLQSNILKKSSSLNMEKRMHQKRLYIKHDKLEKIISNGLTSVDDFFDEGTKLHQIIRHHSNPRKCSLKSSANVSSSKPNTLTNGNHHIRHRPVVNISSQARLAVASCQQEKSNTPFRLSSILSTTTLSVKNKIAKSSPQPHKQQKHSPSKLHLNHKTTTKIPNSDYLSRLNQNDNLLFKCKLCNFLFINSYFLNEHIKTNKHDENKKEHVISFVDKSKYFICSFCNLTFLDKISFLAHISLCSS